MSFAEGCCGFMKVVGRLFNLVYNVKQQKEVLSNMLPINGLVHDGTKTS